MGNRRARFTQAEAERALRAAVAAGHQPRGYTIAPDGSIKVEFGDEAPPACNPLDRVLQQ